MLGSSMIFNFKSLFPHFGSVSLIRSPSGVYGESSKMYQAANHLCMAGYHFICVCDAVLLLVFGDFLERNRIPIMVLE